MSDWLSWSYAKIQLCSPTRNFGIPGRSERGERDCHTQTEYISVISEEGNGEGEKKIKNRKYEQKKVFFAAFSTIAIRLKNDKQCVGSLQMLPALQCRAPPAAISLAHCLNLFALALVANAQIIKRVFTVTEKEKQ